MRSVRHFQYELPVRRKCAPKSWPTTWRLPYRTLPRHENVGGANKPAEGDPAHAVRRKTRGQMTAWIYCGSSAPCSHACSHDARRTSAYVGSWIESWRPNVDPRRAETGTPDAAAVFINRTPSSGDMAVRPRMCKRNVGQCARAQRHWRVSRSSILREIPCHTGREVVWRKTHCRPAPGTHQCGRGAAVYAKTAPSGARSGSALDAVPIMRQYPAAAPGHMPGRLRHEDRWK